MNWDHLRILLTVINAGSFRQASEKTGIHHTTLSRQISLLEKSLGCKLIIRSKQGIILTDDGRAIITELCHIDQKISTILARIQNNDTEATGAIRINLARFLSHKIIYPYLQEFNTLYPNIHIDLISQNVKSNLNKHEADIALWIIERERIPENLVGKSLGAIPTYIYGTADYIEQYRPTELNTKATMIGDNDGLEFIPSLKHSDIRHIRTGLRLDGTYTKAEAAANGQGLAKLPICVAELYKDLIPLGKQACPFPSEELWVLTHPELKKQKRVKAFIDFISLKIKKNNPELFLSY